MIKIPTIAGILQKVFAESIGKSSVSIEVRFFDGSVYRNSDLPPELKITYKTRWAQLDSIINHGWGLIESYIAQAVDIEGDLKLVIKADAESGPSLVENLRMTRIPNPSIRAVI